MSGAHTPGPWTVEPPDHVDIYGNPVPVDLFTPEYWFISGPGADVHGLMTAADASLISAAPDLLEACTRMVAWAAPWKAGKTHPHDDWEFARAAIAKATGGAA